MKRAAHLSYHDEDLFIKSLRPGLLLSLDPGERRVGLAWAIFEGNKKVVRRDDSNATPASKSFLGPFAAKARNRESFSAMAENLLAFAADHGKRISGVVVGNPIHLSGRAR